MRIKITLSLIFCSLLNVALVFAQNIKASGTILDSVDQKPFNQVTVQLKDASGLVKYSTATNDKGLFIFDQVLPNNYVLFVSFLGYKNISKPIQISTNKASVNIGKLYLSEEIQTLKLVTVEGKTPEVTVKTDTLEFSTKNIATRENAVVEDVLKKIPGIEVDKSGAITAQGEKVTKVRVDGKEFFTNDPAMATRNIPADVIDKIQIIDNMSEQSQFSGVDDGNREKIINITTRPGMNQGVFGQLNASKGDIGRYSLNGNYNKFNKESRLSIVSDLNNINKQNFSGSDNSQSGFQRALPNLAGLSSPGIQTVASFGVNYDSELDADTKLHADYAFDKSNLLLNQNSVVQNLSADNNAINTINTNIQNANWRHRFNMRFENQIDSLTSLRMVTGINTNQRNVGNLQNYINVFGNGLRSTQGNQQLQQEAFTPSFSNDLLLRHRFPKKGRTISLSMNTDISNTNLGINNLNQIENFNTMDSALNYQSLIHQYNDQKNKSFSNVLRLEYTEPLAKNLFLELNASNRYNFSDVNRYVFDYNLNTLSYDLLNDSLTNVYNNKFYTNSGGASINYNNKVINWNVGFAVQHTDLFSDNVSKGRSFYQEQINYLPTAMFQYRINRTKRLRFNYRGTTTQPSVDQIAPITDNTNALNIRIGNADLKQSFTHNFRLNFNSFNTTTNIMFFSFIGMNTTQDAISNRIYIDEQGRTVQQTVNVDGVYGGNGFASLSFPVVKDKLRFTASVSGNYNRGVSYLREVLNISQNYTLTNGYKLVYTTEKLDFTLNANITLNKAFYTAQPSSNTRYLTTNYGADVGYMMPGNIRIATDVNYYNNTGRGEGFDRDYIMWNGYLSKQLLKSKQLTVRLSVNDMLKNNLGISRNVNTFSITDLRYNVLQRYYLLTLTYKISTFAGKNMADARRRSSFPEKGNDADGRFRGGR